MNYMYGQVGYGGCSEMTCAMGVVALLSYYCPLQACQEAGLCYGRLEETRRRLLPTLLHKNGATTL